MVTPTVQTTPMTNVTSHDATTEITTGTVKPTSTTPETLKIELTSVPSTNERN